MIDMMKFDSAPLLLSLLSALLQAPERNPFELGCCLDDRLLVVSVDRWGHQ